MSEIIQHNAVAIRINDKHTLLATVVPTDTIMSSNKGCDIRYMGASTTKNPLSKQSQITLNTDSMEERKDWIGMGIQGIVTQPIWGIKRHKNPFADLWS